MFLRVQPDPFFGFALRRAGSKPKYNGPKNPALTYDVLVTLKRRNAKPLVERCTDAMSVPKVGQIVGFRRVHGVVTSVVFRSTGPIEITLEYPATNRD